MTIDKDKRIRELEETVARLLDRIAELERRLGMNSSNSSMPPSSDKPGDKTVAAQKPGEKKKKRGAQNGHLKQNKALLPKEQVTELVELLPEVCPACGKTLFKDCGESPLRDQFIELPPIKSEVTEIRRPILACVACGQRAYAALPENTPRHTFGSGVVAMVGVLTGLLNISKRKAQLMMRDVFHVPMSLGAITAWRKCSKNLMKKCLPPHDLASSATPTRQAGRLATCSRDGCGCCPTTRLRRSWCMKSAGRLRRKTSGRLFRHAGQ